FLGRVGGVGEKRDGAGTDQVGGRRDGGRRRAGNRQPGRRGRGFDDPRTGKGASTERQGEEGAQRDASLERGRHLPAPRPSGAIVMAKISDPILRPASPPGASALC